MDKNKKFEKVLKSWNIVHKDNIVNITNNVLYIIGNGFDLMYGIKSSYWNFQESY